MTYGGAAAYLFYVFSVSLLYIALLCLIFFGFVIGPQWAPAAAFVVVGIYGFLGLRRRRAVWAKGLSVHPDVSDISPNLGAIMRDLYARSGLSPRDYPLYDFRAPASPDAGQENAPQEGLAAMAAVPSAAVLELGQPVLAVSTRLLALMDDEEERAVLAHECIHLTENHVYLSYIARMLAGVVLWMVTFIKIAWFFLADGHVLQIAFAAAVGVALVAIYSGWAGRGMLPVEYLNGDKNKISARRRVVYSRVMSYMTRAALIVMCLFHPVYFVIYALLEIIRYVALVVAYGVSRVNEYRADAEIVRLGASPLSMITALRKLTILEDRARGNGRRPAAWRLRLFSTHPLTPQRLRALEKQAVRLGYAAAEIEKAVEGDIHIDSTHDYPLWLVQRMQQQ